MPPSSSISLPHFRRSICTRFWRTPCDCYTTTGPRPFRSTLCPSCSPAATSWPAPRPVRCLDILLLLLLDFLDAHLRLLFSTYYLHAITLLNRNVYNILYISGSGKTAAFLMPILQHIYSNGITPPPPQNRPFRVCKCRCTCFYCCCFSFDVNELRLGYKFIKRILVGLRSACRRRIRSTQRRW